jgi:branched-subunit amino acid ABC-type transport system permease component
LTVLVALGLWAAITMRPLLVAGVVAGAVLSLGALGLTITYGVFRFADLSYGLSIMLGAYLTLFFYTGRIRRSALEIGDAIVPANFGNLPHATAQIGDFSFGYGFFLAILAAAVVMILILLFIDWAVYARFRRRRKTGGVLSLTIVSFGLAYITIGVINALWGTFPRSLTGGFHPARTYPLGIAIKSDELFMLAGAATLTAVAYIVIFRTTTGKAMRALADNPSLAQASGIDIEKTVRLTWALVAILATVAGALIALQSQLNPQLGLAILLPLFAAAAVGGLGNPLGALVGGITVGIAEDLSVAFISPTYKIGVAFAILAAVLLFKPTGLLGTRS